MEVSQIEYTIREYEPEDRGDALELLHGLFRDEIADVADEWFDWRFHENPYATRVPMTVAVRDGRVVGLLTNFPIPVSVNGRRERAVLHGDAVVHPDHRRKGVFSNVVEHERRRVRRSDAVLSYGTPNEKSLAAVQGNDSLRRLERGIVTTIPEYYRVRNEEVVLDAMRRRNVPDHPLSRRVAAKLTNRSPFRRAERGTGDAAVKRHSGVPARLVASVADGRRETGIRAVRDETFYRWRFANPRYEYSTYTVESGGVTVASVVVEEDPEPVGDRTVSRVMDVQVADDRSGGTDAARRLARAIDRGVGSDLVATRGVAFPQHQLPSLELRSVISAVYTRAASGSKLVAYPLTDDATGSRLHGLDLSDPSNWRLSWCDSQLG